MLAFVMWAGLAGAMTGRRSWLLGLGLVVLAIGSMVLIGGNAAAGQAPPTVPTGSESAKVEALARQFAGGDRVPLILVVSRAAVFCVLGVLPLIVLTRLGIIVGLGILLDTFVVRTLVIPALFAPIGDRIWWPATNAKPVEQQADLAQHERSTV